MSIVNYFPSSSYNDYRIGFNSVTSCSSVVPFPKINFTSMYDNVNKNLEEIKQQKEDKEKKNERKRCRKLFTKEEDEKIKELTEKYGTKQWNIIAQFIEGRTPKQCRDRYCNYLFPGIFNGEWSTEEDELLMELYKKYGPRWTTLQRSFPYRSANTIKNRWDFFLCRQIDDPNIKMKLDNNKTNDKKPTENNETKNNESNQTPSNIYMMNRKEKYSNIFETDLNDESFELMQEDDLFEITNDLYEYY